MLSNLSLDQYNEIKDQNDACAFYFSTPGCNVCKVLKPKLFSFLEQTFPKIKLHYIDLEENKQLGAELNIFSVPTVLFYFEGKEFLRKSRFINLEELADEIGRVYNLMFE